MYIREKYLCPLIIFGAVIFIHTETSQSSPLPSNIGNPNDSIGKILDKRYSLLPGCINGSYQVFSQKFDGGHQFFANNKALNINPQTSEFSAIDSKSFKLKTVDFGSNDFREKFGSSPAGIIVRTVTITSPTTISIETHSSLLNIFGDHQGSVKYLETTKITKAQLCP